MARASSLLLCPKGCYDIRMFAIIVCQYRVIIFFFLYVSPCSPLHSYYPSSWGGCECGCSSCYVCFCFLLVCYCVFFFFLSLYIYILFVLVMFVLLVPMCPSCSCFLFSYCYCFVGLPLVVPACVCFMCVDNFSWSFFFSCSLLRVFCFENSNTLRIHVFPEKSYPKYFLRRQLDP